MRLNVQMVTCPLCHLDHILSPDRLPAARGDNGGVACPRCGRYILSGSLNAIFSQSEPNEQRMRLSAAIRERSVNGLDSRLLTDTKLEALLLAPWPDTAGAKTRRLLANLVNMSSHPGMELDIELPQDAALAFTIHPEEFAHYLKELEDGGLIKVTVRTLRGMRIKVTNSGFEQVEAEAANQHHVVPTSENAGRSVQGEGMPIPVESKVDRRKVFVIHGRNQQAHDAMIEFLRSLDLAPVDFNQAKLAMKKHPFTIAEVLDYAFNNAWAVMVLITGDDEGRLRECHQGEHEHREEREFHPQPRLNVVFEAGLALARNPKRTILVKVGDAKAFSDLAGVYIHQFRGTPQDRDALKEFLKGAGCAVGDVSSDWLSAGDFALALHRVDPGTPPQGTATSTPALTNEEKELIIACGKDGQFLKMSVGNFHSTWIVAGGKNFLNEDEPAYAAIYLEAFERLCAKGIVRFEDGSLFVLTGSGHKLQAELIATTGEA